MKKFFASILSFIFAIDCHLARGEPIPIFRPPELNTIALHGTFDPSLEKDPSSDRLWMAFSAVANSTLHGTRNGLSVSTHIMFSDDFGVNWHYPPSNGDVNHVKDFYFYLNSRKKRGSWINEVADLACDPDAPPHQRCILVWHRYLNINGTAARALGWISVKMASSPTGLKSAQELKLISGAHYDDDLNNSEGVLKSPVVGPPKIRLNELHVDLEGCVFSEPSVLARHNVLYLALLCVKSNRPPYRFNLEHRIVLFRCGTTISACQITSPTNWIYLGRLLDEKDSAKLKFPVGISAPEIVTQNGFDYLMVSPVSNSPSTNSYNGCRIYRIVNLDSATLHRVNGSPVEYGRVEGRPRTFSGACTYHPLNRWGVIYSEAARASSSDQTFRTYHSGIRPRAQP